ncbi:hypothetical protein P153DRAFT_300884 [Dothidotthia symphoricarpi CBS 119687]|uniref:Uncharacterized protein n=1 Tax=Dothidotthia symphoricarpi CBS 119687 TaxID=1392245 RepID=A0A6A6A0F1_9PLEO|nr:uncharacterized protein P153DRAFT_300884 [Dothidotthia symphoricarpi CBS 119687]KAF2124996.1 hypothetical protein P153DRAFT_300884 [Dothidotthia symphoricarpi CBS 119687]
MEGPPKYAPLSGEELEELGYVEAKDGFAWNSDSTEIIPTNTRSFVAYLSIMLLSLCANVLLVMDNAKLRNMTRDTGRTIYSGLTFDTQIPYHSMSKYWNPNLTDSDMDLAWDAIDTNAMAIALPDDYSESVGLFPSTRFPWDTERSIYYVKGIHDLHCLKLIRKAITSKHNNSSQTFNLNHIYHCFEGLRQDIMCTADDTPMPASAERHVGDGQIRQCRDWNKMTSWATQPGLHACYNFDDYREATNTLELFAFCPPESPYRSIQQAYFEYHGHKSPYEPKVDDEQAIVF